MSKPATIPQHSDVLARIEILLEQIYDVVQDIRDTDESTWLTPEIQVQIEQARQEAQRGDYVELGDATDLIHHLHTSHYAQT